MLNCYEKIFVFSYVFEFLKYLIDIFKYLYIYIFKIRLNYMIVYLDMLCVFACREKKGVIN